MFSISAAPDKPTSPVNRQYVDSLTYLKIGKGLYLTDGVIGALDIQCDLLARPRLDQLPRAPSVASTGTGAGRSGPERLPNGGGISTTGAVYAGSFVQGTLPLATEQFVLEKNYLTMANAATTYETILNLGAGLQKTGGVLSVSAALPHVTSVGSLDSLTVRGGATLQSTLTLTSSTAATSTTTGAIVLPNGGGIGTSGSVHANGMFLSGFMCKTRVTSPPQRRTLLSSLGSRLVPA